jgi:hypothetical protein
MAKLLQTRIGQYVMEAQYVFNFDDTAANTSGAVVDFGKTNTAATTFDIIDLPVGATVIGGELVTDTAFNAATSYTVAIGDSASAGRYLASADRKSAARVALTLTGYRTDGSPIRLSVTSNAACTTGKATVRVQFTVEGRGNENTM